MPPARRIASVRLVRSLYAHGLDVSEPAHLRMTPAPPFA